MQMRTCLYCKQLKKYNGRIAALSEFDTEHVLMQAFGKFQHNLTLTKDVCKVCNSKFSRELDRAFARDSIEGYLRYVHGVKSGNKIAEFKGQRATVQLMDPISPLNRALVDHRVSNGKLEALLKAQVRIEDASAEGGWKAFTLAEVQHPEFGNLVRRAYKTNSKIQILADTDEEYELLCSALTEHGLQWEDTQTILPFTSPVTLEEFPDETIHRAIAKIAFNYATKNLGAPYMLGDDFDAARNYIMEGVRPQFPIVVPMKKPAFDKSSKFALFLGHILTVNWSMFNECMCLVALVSLFNQRYFRVQLSDNIKGLFMDKKIGHLFEIESNPRQCMELDEDSFNEI